MTSIDKGKVFLNGAEAGRADAGARLRGGDLVRVWMDRPGSARRPRRPTAVGELEILCEDDALIVVNKPAGLLAVPLERKSDAPSVYEHIETHLRPHGKRRSRHVWSRRLCQDVTRAGVPQDTVQAA